MPGITLDPGDAAELAEMLAFLADWLSGSQKHVLAGSLAAFVGHPAYNADTLCADLHRFCLPPRSQQRRRTLRRADTMTGKTGPLHPPPDKILPAEYVRLSSVLLVRSGARTMARSVRVSAGDYAGASRRQFCRGVPRPPGTAS